MNSFLLLVASIALQVATSSEAQHQDAFSFENNFKTRFNPITIEEKNLTIINGTRYYFSIVDANRYEAQLTCEEFGMELVSLETQAESDSVYEYIQQQNINRPYHTSAVRINDKFSWSTTYLDYENWGPGEPTETGTIYQSCVVFFAGVLFDEPCVFDRHIICEDSRIC